MPKSKHKTWMKKKIKKLLDLDKKIAKVKQKRVVERYTFEEFKTFLAEKCWDLKKYKEGKYDREIYNWFGLNKPRKIEFLIEIHPPKR